MGALGVERIFPEGVNSGFSQG